jgi:DNA-binding protein H-NS
LKAAVAAGQAIEDFLVKSDGAQKSRAAAESGAASAKKIPRRATKSPAKGRRPAKKAAATKAPSRKRSGAKYSDGAGNNWSGRGPRPKWLKDAVAGGRKLESFAV